MSIEEADFKKRLEAEGYFDLREIEGRGMCGLIHFVFTIGLCYGLNEYSYKGRYCFDNLVDANESILTWNGVGDPPGNWIKHKGHTEYSNPKLQPQKVKPMTPQSNAKETPETKPLTQMLNEAYNMGVEHSIKIVEENWKNSPITRFAYTDDTYKNLISELDKLKRL